MQSLSELIATYNKPDILLDSFNPSSKKYAAWGFDEIFEIIAEKLNDNPFLYTIKFDQSFGYPIDIYFDMDEMIADEEIGYYVTNFKIE